MTDTQQLDPVATTARLTAAARERESKRPDRLFDDPMAATLAGEPGRALLAEFDGALGDSPFIPVRDRCFDDALVGTDIPQIVLVAAGMDTRAYRLELPAGTTMFELDRPELLRLKDTLLADAAARCARRSVPVDLTTDWGPALTAAAFQRDQPTCWLASGLTQYLPENDVHRLLDRITELSAPGSRVLIDFIGQSLLDSPVMRPMLDLFDARDMSWVFGTERPEDLLTARGWHPEVTRLGAYGTRLGRWPFPDLPRGTPDIPQGYFVSADR